MDDDRHGMFSLPPIIYLPESCAPRRDIPAHKELGTALLQRCSIGCVTVGLGPIPDEAWITRPAEKPKIVTAPEPKFRMDIWRESDPFDRPPPGRAGSGDRSAA